MLRISCCALVVSLTSLASIASAARPGSGDRYAQGTSAARAVSLVEQALSAGLAGDAATRTELLDEAVAANPDYAPARWQKGEVKFNGKWQTPKQVAELVSTDERYEQYRQMRDTSAGRVDDHIALAEWCMRQGLANEERYHWINVILAAPNHKLARQRLELREYRGGLFTEQQIAEHQQQMEQAEADAKKYRPQFIQLVRKARSESKAVREAALDKIRAVSEVGAIEPLVEAIGRNKRDVADEYTLDLHRAVVAALSNMREHNATLYLLNYAVFAQNEDVRKHAAEALKSRAPTDYVPLLMGALTAPIEAEFDVVAAPDGTVRMVETLVQAGPERDRTHTQATHFEVAGTFGRDRLKTNPNAVVAKHLRRAEEHAEYTQSQVDSYNAAAKERNQRIKEVLEIATGMTGDARPEDYWKAWSAENELAYGATPVYETYDEYTYTHTYAQAPKYPVSTGPTRSSSPGAAPTPRQPGDPIAATSPVALPMCECFAAGTLVWTQAGPRPIEQVSVGDMVLAQHPTTGELAYRPVLEVTARDDAPVMRLAVSGEEIYATPGHRFWVNGRGWQMAKHLKPAVDLHAIDAPLSVSAVEKDQPRRCYNLVVDEFHTFIVGQSRLLVHDKSCPAPTMAIVPGLTKVTSEAAQASGY
ncbi:MAG TPA: polymorphic toxin-type HINT domain-containing protein [Lacipirellula sp.]